MVSRVVPASDLDETVMQMAEQIASSPAVTVKMAREVIRHLSIPTVRASMADEMIYQTFVNRSDDFAEFKAARTSGAATPLQRQLRASRGHRSVCHLRRLQANPRSRRGPSTGSVSSSQEAGPGLGKAIAIEFATARSCRS